MKYKTEVMINNSVVKTYVLSTITPKDAVRLSITKFISDTKTKPEYFSLFVLNEIGQIWKYSAMKKPTGQYYIMPASNIPDVIPKNEVIDAFAGNEQISKIQTR